MSYIKTTDPSMLLMTKPTLLALSIKAALTMTSWLSDTQAKAWAERIRQGGAE